MARYDYQIIDGRWHHAPRPKRAAGRHSLKEVGARAFASAKQDRLTASFRGTSLSINEELRRDLPKLQHRSRQLWMDNDYAKHFFRMLKTHVIGPNGINLQCQFPGRAGQQDTADNNLVELHWRKWSKKDHCSIDGRNSWKDLQRLAIETIGRDGEVLVEKIFDKRSRYGLKLRLLECDHLDVAHNELLRNGNRVVMGIELDSMDRPVAYHLSELHPGDRYQVSGPRRRRVMADRIMHIFITERPGQLRGIPWMHTAIKRLNMLGGYEEAELVAARVGASKMGFYTSEAGDGPTPDEMSPDGQDYDDSELVEVAEPGTFHNLPAGVDFTSFDPQHPSTAYESFTRGMLRGTATGIGVAYNSWANDLEGVNFSSIRAGTLEERDQWRVLQDWLAEQLHDGVYSGWLTWQIDFGSLTALPAEKIESKYSEITWQPRGWQWVDPLKDTKANADEYALGTTTLTQICRAKGKDLRDILVERKAELDLAAEIGVTVGTVNEVAINLLGEDDENTQKS